MPERTLICDGCGQLADQEHIAGRLKRLENMTRYRPIHVQALLLGVMSPADDAGYLYSAGQEFRGEGLTLLRALGMDPVGRSVEAVLTDFQRRGYLFTHILECAAQSLDPNIAAVSVEGRVAATAARIRRSFKPKRMILIGDSLDCFAERLVTELPGIDIVRPEKGRTFRLDELAPGALAALLNTTVAASL